MKLPRTETTLAAVLLLSAAPFALAVPPGAGSTMPSTPGVTPPETTPSTTYPGMTPPPGGVYQPGGQYQQDMQRGNATSTKGWSRSSQMPSRSAERLSKSDIAAARNAKVSLTDAINAAQQQNHDEVVSVRFEVRQGKPEYLIRSFDSRSQQEWLGHVDANTGKVIGQGRTIALSSLPKEDQQELTASRSSSTTLGQAVQSAEQQRGGKALSAGLSARNGRVSYRTELLKSDGRTQMAMVSPQSGEVSSFR